MYWPSPNRSMPVSADPTQSLTAPSGSARAEVVPTSQRTSHPREEKSESASRARRLFSTPGAPQMTVPDESRSDTADSISRNSSERPVSGHRKRTH